jgi:hypothetical protein
MHKEEDINRNIEDVTIKRALVVRGEAGVLEGAASKPV